MHSSCPAACLDSPLQPAWIARCSLLLLVLGVLDGGRARSHGGGGGIGFMRAREVCIISKGRKALGWDTKQARKTNESARCRRAPPWQPVLVGVVGILHVVGRCVQEVSRSLVHVPAPWLGELRKIRDAADYFFAVEP